MPTEKPIEPSVIQAAWQLGMIAPARMCKIACEALEQGLDGKSLRRLAGLNSPTRRDIERLVQSAIVEMGLAGTVDRPEAVNVYSRHIAKEICGGWIDPHEGAKKIAELYYGGNLREEFLSFIGLESEYEDHPELKDEIGREIVEAAKEFLTL